MSNFDYTNRDYTSIQEDLLARAATVFPEWTSREPSDFGMVFVDLWAYMGDVLHFYVDRAAREAFLNTASQRESVLAVANLLDYVPSGRQPARARITLDASATTATDSAPIYIPQYTKFVATPLLDKASSVIFTLDNPIAFTATSAGASVDLVSDGIVYATYPKTVTVEVAVTEGEVFTETYTSTGRVSQRIPLKKSGVVAETVSVSIAEGANGTEVPYRFSSRIILGTAASRIFTIETDADDTAYVVFGNGVNGRIPTINAPITITYRRSRGAAGNVNVGAIKSLQSTTVLNKPPLNGLVVIPNTIKASGGVDYESIASLRANIPASFRTQGRAVSLQDYKDIVKRVPGIVRSTAYVDGSDVVQILATETLTNFGDSLTAVLPSAKVTEIEEYLAPREITFVTSNVGASVTFTPVNFAASVSVLDGYVRELVKDDVNTAVKELFSFDSMDFGASVSLGTVYRTILNVEGVNYAVITRFTTTGSNVIDSSGGFTGVGASSTSMLTMGSTSSYTVTYSGGITAIGT